MTIYNVSTGSKSKNKLTAALLKLMTTNIYFEITITQICQEAQLSRKTFYRLFKTKDEILSEYLIDMHKNFLLKVKGTHSRAYQDIASAYFEFWHSHKDLLLLIKKQDFPFDFNAISHANAIDIYNLVKSDETNPLDDKMVSYMLAYCIGGLNSMLTLWIDQGALFSPNDLSCILKVILETPLF